MKTRRELAAQVRAVAYRFEQGDLPTDAKQVSDLLIECAAGLIESQTLDENHAQLLEALENTRTGSADHASAEKEQAAIEAAYRFRRNYQRDEPA